MIKFFRRIRQKLLTENRFSKYLIYAIGEIILVMIGILLALQVNNWNESRKLKKTQTLYLKSLKQNLIDSKNELDRVISESKRTSNSLKRLVSIIKEDSQSHNIKEIDSLIMAGMSYTKYQTRQGVINELISSGQVNIIENDYLRAEIVSWDANLIDLREIEEISKKGFYDYSKCLSSYFDFSGITPQSEIFKDDLKKDFFNDLKTRNTIANVSFSSVVLNQSYEKKKQHIDTLLSIINNELKQSHD